MTGSKGGLLSVVGIGPGGREHITPRALKVLQEAEVIIGYSTYIKLVEDLVDGAELVAAGMTEEMKRAQDAVGRALDGQRVAVVSSGDAAVYGMCGLLFEVLKESGWTRGSETQVEVIPGVSAINSCGSLVGAILGHDYCTISLSDLLTPWPVIQKRLRCAAEADFVIGLYNPASKRRRDHIVEAQSIICETRPGSTPVALIKSAYRDEQRVQISTLDSFLECDIDMNTTVVVGSSQSFEFEDYIITPRGYTNKYAWDGTAFEGQTPGRTIVVD